ncbi:FecR domain-containing protein, partial [Novosphingobium sp. 1949]
CAALVAGACVLAWPQVRFWMTPEQTYATRPGQILRVTLADGSRLVLNGRSRLSVRLAPDRREVRLEAGEALFDVYHDAARPFSVASAEGTVNVLGTRFDLARNAGSLDLVVERGLVRFAGNQPGVNAVDVAAAHRASLVDGRIAPPERIALQDYEGDWREGWLQVSDMPLGALVARLQRWSAKPIEVDDPALLRVRVAGRLRLDDPAQLLENLGVLHGFAVRTTSRAYVLDRP